MLLLAVLIKVDEKYLIFQYIFIGPTKRSQNSFQIISLKNKTLFCILMSRKFQQLWKLFDLTQEFCCCWAYFYVKMLCIWEKNPTIILYIVHLC